MKNFFKVLSVLCVAAMLLSTCAFAEEADGWNGAYVSAEDYKAYIEYDLDRLVLDIKDQLTAEQLQAVEAAQAEGVANIEAAGTLEAVDAAYDAAVAAIEDCVPLADGIFSYLKLSNADRTKILGILETYAVANGITGISLFEDGGYVMYNPRVTLGTENYIVGYGFGTLAEGSITADLDYETNDAWKRYYHTFESSDPGTLNYLNDQGSQVGDIYSYMGASFFTNFMNETKDGYDWVPELAKEKPVAVNDDDGDGMCTTWRFEVRTGKDGLVYTTGSKLEDRAAFNGREVALEDYIYPFQLLLTQANGLYRGAEMANQTNSGAIAGVKDYYDASVDGFNADAWDKVGLKVYEEDGKDYFEVTFKGELTQFYAMYYISSSLYMPVPQEFVELCTVTNYLGFNADATVSPVDNSLTTGAYYLETYDPDQQIVFKKNPTYIFADTKYAIPGVHIKIFTAATEDTTAGIKEFLAGHFDATGIPKDYLNEYRNDPRTRSTTGTSNFKLNMNATDAETWAYLFGENGVVTQTPVSDYWASKPILANGHFIKGLSFSIDRNTFANARGSIPSVDYLSSNYMSDPENGLSYSVTEAHKKAVESLLDDTDGYGYNLEMARDYFRVALSEVEAAGYYQPGTPENPTVINIEIAWMYPTHEENYHNEIKNYIETAFNDPSVCGGVYQLSVDFWVGNNWDEVYYNKMMVGQFDLGFGSISGNSLDPIGFVSVLSSDQAISGSFTLNWGTDTNDPAARAIVYDGMRWSFDALYNAVNGSAIVAGGKNMVALSFDYENIVKNEDGSYTGAFIVKPALPDQTGFTATQIACCNYERYYNGDKQYDETMVEFVTEQIEGGYKVIFTVPADLAADYATGSGTSAEPTGYTGFDLYYDMDVAGNASSSYYSVEDSFVIE